MKRYTKSSIQSYHGARKYKWAFRMLFIAISMSLFFGFISQTLLTKMGIVVASIGICFFIFISVSFDMLGIAAASAEKEVFEKWEREGVRGAKVGLKMCHNSEKVCSFCADVVGDICSTLCGAGGACIVVALTKNIENSHIIMFTSILMSALIAGITIFFKALMKERALKKSNKIILKMGIFLEKTIFKDKIEKNKKVDKNG